MVLLPPEIPHQGAIPTHVVHPLHEAQELRVGHLISSLELLWQALAHFPFHLPTQEEVVTNLIHLHVIIRYFTLDVVEVSRVSLWRIHLSKGWGDCMRELNMLFEVTDIVGEIECSLSLRSNLLYCS